MTAPSTLPHRAWTATKAIWLWLHGLRDALKTLLLVLLALSTTGFYLYVRDTANQAVARSLLANGTTTYAVQSRLHITHHDGGGGGHYDIDHVSVTLPGIENSVSLTITQTPYLDHVPEGWQSPSLQTGYVAPFKVRYRVESDGTVTAAAADDVEYWSGNGPDGGVDTGVLLLLGFGGLLGMTLTVAGIVAGRAVLARRTPAAPDQGNTTPQDAIVAHASRTVATSAFVAHGASPPSPPSRASRHVGEPETLTFRDRWVQSRTAPRRRITDRKNDLSATLFATIMGPICVAVGFDRLREPGSWYAHARLAGLAVFGLAVIAALIFYLLRPATIPPDDPPSK